MCLVSIILPAYQAEKCLTRAIEFVRAQDYVNWELLIVDDGSTDGTLGLAKEFASIDKRIKVYSLLANSGPAAARNVGLRSASGVWIALIDADDAWKPERLTIMLASDKGETVIIDNLMTYDAHMQIETGVFNDLEEGYWGLDDVLLERVNGVMFNPGLHKPIIRKSFIDKNNLHYDENVRYGEDYIFELSLLCCGAKVKAIHYAGYIYTMWVGKRSKEKSAHTQSIMNYRGIATAMEAVFAKYSSGFTAGLLFCSKTKSKI